MVKEAVWDLRHSDYYRSAITERIFGQQEADCVFRFVYLDRQHTWISRAQWISPALPEKFRPMIWKGQEQFDGIVIDWRQDYEAKRAYFERSTKREWAKKVEALLPEIQDLVDRAAAAFEARLSGQLSDDDFGQTMTAWEAEALTLLRRGENEKVPPVECADANQAFQQLVTTFHNIFVPFAYWSRLSRNWRYKEWHLRTYLADYEMQLHRFQHEWDKVK